MSLDVKDAAIREEALNLNQSFIVQAPAGSGKTTLLTQRFLCALATVSTPEAVLALTFTRKAASEMRQRVISILHMADSQPDMLLPSTLHHAKRVLNQDAQYTWHLLKTPHRLKIMTFDALYQWILKKYPISYMTEAQIDPYPLRLYRYAAYDCMYALMEAHSPDLLKLMQHIDNRQDRLIHFWVDLLTYRDQWLPILYQYKVMTRSVVDQWLCTLISQYIEDLNKHLPVTLQQALCALLRTCAADLTAYHDFNDCDDLSTLTIQQAKHLANLLLTQTKKMRKRVDAHVIDPHYFSKVQYHHLKKESEQLFTKIAPYEAFIQTLIDITYLPTSGYTAAQWSLLEALFMLLPTLVAHLKLVFQKQHRVDFIEMATYATEALGHEDSPSELCLYLDHQIQHLLVDEFQDTSFSQFEFLLKLTAGFEENDGRTIFIVGDPMQSIYRFRQAEVGLFLQIQQYGIGQKKLKTLYLNTNFRSVPSLIAWVNQQFSHVFPKKEDLTLGAVVFHPSIAVLDHIQDVTLQAIETTDQFAEATYIVQQIQEHLQKHADESIAILVRSRQQLEMIVPVLQAAGIDFEGSDLFALSQLGMLQDIWHLTQALLFPHEKLPWLCLLRSPYVGITLPDLHCIACCTNNIYFELENIIMHTALSEDGRSRLKRVQDLFQNAFDEKDQYSLSEWIMKIHLQLQDQEKLELTSLPHIMQFMHLLTAFTEHNTIVDIEMFNFYFKRLYIQALANTKVKVMTIHQAKGLEFDTVFIPSLGARVRQSQQPLLRIVRLLRHHYPLSWLISPIKSTESLSDEIYDYLTYRVNKSDAIEQQRLLYVAVTRAKKRLYLLDYRSVPSKESFRTYLSQQAFVDYPISVPAMAKKTSMYIDRLPLETYLAVLPQTMHLTEKVCLNLPTYQEQMGSFIHRWIKIICEHVIQTIHQCPWVMMERMLEALGWIEQDKTGAMAVVSQALHHLFHSRIGQWLIAKHPYAKNEYAFTVFEGGVGKTYIVDRLFYDKEKWWIIDFKTGATTYMTSHQEQVNRYAHYLSRQLEGKIACGLFYLKTGQWETWDYPPVQGCPI